MVAEDGRSGWKVVERAGCFGVLFGLVTGGFWAASQGRGDSVLKPIVGRDRAFGLHCSWVLVLGAGQCVLLFTKLLLAWVLWWKLALLEDSAGAVRGRIGPGGVVLEGESCLVVCGLEADLYSMRDRLHNVSKRFRCGR